MVAELDSSKNDSEVSIALDLLKNKFTELNERNNTLKDNIFNRTLPKEYRSILEDEFSHNQKYCRYLETCIGELEKPANSNLDRDKINDLIQNNTNDEAIYDTLALDLQVSLKEKIDKNSATHNLQENLKEKTDEHSASSNKSLYTTIIEFFKYIANTIENICKKPLSEEFNTKMSGLEKECEKPKPNINYIKNTIEDIKIYLLLEIENFFDNVEDYFNKPKSSPKDNQESKKSNNEIKMGKIAEDLKQVSPESSGELLKNNAQDKTSNEQDETIENQDPNSFKMR